MAVKRPIFTESFSANLENIKSFLGADGASYFARFFDRLVDDIVPQVWRFPLSGRSFLDRSIRSAQAEALAERLRDKLKEGDDVREFIVEGFLILYLVRGQRVVFLSIKHHRQLSYDLLTFWRE